MGELATAQVPQPMVECMLNAWGVHQQERMKNLGVWRQLRDFLKA